MIDSDIRNYIELQSKIISRKHWSEEYTDLIHEGIVSVLEIQKSNSGISKEALLKRLRNFYSAKRRKIRDYERRNISLGDNIKDPIKEEPIGDLKTNEKDGQLDDQLIVELVKQYGFDKRELAELLGMNKNELYNKTERK